MKDAAAVREGGGGHSFARHFSPARQSYFERCAPGGTGPAIESCRHRNNPGWFISSISSILQIVWRHTKPYPTRLFGRFRRLSPNLQLVLQ
ncbi:hypothetical protein EMIT0158MI4_60157 [Burkholderia ambifaria]